MLTIKNDRYFEKDGKPFFYLADTVWSTFTNVSMEDWKYYLKERKRQGYNVLQINTMPQWDRSVTESTYNNYPFAVEDNYFNVDEIDAQYFERAAAMIEVAVEMGFTPALVILWCNYIEGTWAANFGKTPMFKKSSVEAYTEIVYNYFDKFNPIYIVSGDTDFLNEDSNEHYELSLNKIGELSPNTLKVLHIRGRDFEIPDNLRSNKYLSFYYFQSGHNISNMNMPYKLATDFYEMEPKKPSLNSEPCYEFMGYSRGLYGRFTRQNVRTAAWQSVFAGATSGITYGAHGIWSWHEYDAVFGADLGESFIAPMCWRDALQLKGAEDYGYLKDFVLTNNLLDASPASKVINEIEQIRAIETDTNLYVYVPVSYRIKIEGLYSSVNYLDLVTKVKSVPQYTTENNMTIIELTSCINDYVIILEK